MTDDVSPLIQRVISTSSGGRPGLITRLLRMRLHGSKNVPEVRSWTKEEIADVLAELATKRVILTRRELQELHNKQPKRYPAPITIETIFNPDGWSTALVASGLKPARVEPLRTIGLDIIGKPPPEDVLYFLDLYRKFGLTSTALYEEAHRKYPEVVPQYSKLVKAVGGISVLSYLAKLESCEDQLMTLVALMYELNGRWPRKQLCRQHAIDRRHLEKKFGGKIELEELCRELLVFYREQKKTEVNKKEPDEK